MRKPFLSLLLVLLVHLVATPVWAQTAKSRADLYTDANAALADTGEEAITPEDLRTLFKDMVASSYNGLTDGGLGTMAAEAAADYLTAAQIASGYQPLAAVLTNTTAAFTTEQASKLAGIASGATANAGTVTSVAASVPTGLSISGSPVTTSGTLALSLTSGYVIPQQTALDAKAATATTLTAGTGLTGGGDLSANRSFALSTGSIASLALADSATQPADLGTAGVLDVGTGSGDVAAGNRGLPTGGTTGQALVKTSGTDYAVEWDDVGGEGGSSTLSGLSDVTITAAADGDALVYNGAAWVDTALAAVATSGAYSDLSGTPTLGTAAAEDVGDFATAAQGTLADSATQPGDLATVATSGDYDDLTDKPTIPSAIFSTLAISGQDSVVADSATDTLTLVAGSNITLTTDDSTDTITIAASGGGGGGAKVALKGGSLANGTLPSSATRYFGSNDAQIPNAAAASSRIYVPISGTITAVYVFGNAGTSGSDEAWPLYIQDNDTNESLIESITVGTAQRAWVNAGLSFGVTAGDWVTIKSVSPAWGTAPANINFSVIILIEE